MVIVLGAITLLVAALLLPVKVRVRFARKCGRSSTYVRVGVFYGLVWLPVYSAVSQPREPCADEASMTRRAGEADPLGELAAILRIFGHGGKDLPRATPSGGKEGSRRGAMRLARSLYRAAKSVGLDVLKLVIDMEIGTDKAATSAIAVGVAHGLIGAAIAASPVELRFPRGRPEIKIAPRYGAPGLDFVVDCVIATSAVLMVLRALRAKTENGGAGRRQRGPETRRLRTG